MFGARYSAVVRLADGAAARNRRGLNMDYRLVDCNRYTSADLVNMDWATMLNPDHKIVRRVATVRKAASDRRVLDFMVKVQSSVWGRCNW